MGAAVEVVEELYAAFATRDVERALACLADDVVMTQDDALPWGGRFEGHDGALTFFGTLVSTIDSAVTHLAMYQAGDTVVQYGRTAGTVRANGASFDVPECHVWRVRDGKIVAGEMLIDSEAMLDALGR
jgi:ketosteroid isomerase-like protein